MNLPDGLETVFEARYGREPRVFRAPGRVNIIGEHTDYNDGFVMPAAIQFATSVAAAARTDRKLQAYSEMFRDAREFDLDDEAPAAQGDWTDYVRGIAVTLERAGYHLRGADLVIRGNVPIGAGLSSSAAIEVATASALLAVSGLSLPPTEIARLCQRAENEFVGMRCGIMDQFVSCCGRAGHALMLDCRSLDYQLIPIPPAARLVISNTMVHHELAHSEYNQRRADCEAAVRHLAHSLPYIRALRDVTLAELEQYGRDLPDTVFRRCRHVISENGRVLQGSAALLNADLDAFGRRMIESHESLRSDYEVSCDELDLMVELALGVEGVYGARMTGGGFGGCTVNLVQASKVDVFQELVSTGYEKATGKKPSIYSTSAMDGAAEVALN